MALDWKRHLADAFASIGKLGILSPGTLAGYKALHAAGGQTNHLTVKTRELICIAVAVTTRCDTCIANHVEKAIEAGATQEEIAEALGVAVAMNAGAAIAYSGRAIEAYNSLSAKK
jgi:AhpD family alkylhydroperoxidase